MWLKIPADSSANIWACTKFRTQSRKSTVHRTRTLEFAFLVYDSDYVILGSTSSWRLGFLTYVKGHCNAYYSKKLLWNSQLPMNISLFYTLFRYFSASPQASIATTECSILSAIKLLSVPMCRLTLILWRQKSLLLYSIMTCVTSRD